MTARWQGTIALLLLIIISYIDRVNISVMILNPEFAEHFQLNENRMLQGMLMTCFLLGYGFSALLLTPVIESKLHYRQGLLSSVAIWAVVCAVSPLLGSLMGMVMKSVGSVSSGFSVLVVSQAITMLAGGMLLLRMRRAAAVSA